MFFSLLLRFRICSCIFVFAQFRENPRPTNRFLHVHFFAEVITPHRYGNFRIFAFDSEKSRRIQTRIPHAQLLIWPNFFMQSYPPFLAVLQARPFLGPRISSSFASSPPLVHQRMLLPIYFPVLFKSGLLKTFCSHCLIVGSCLRQFWGIGQIVGRAQLSIMFDNINK